MECDLHSQVCLPASLVFVIFMFEKFRRENLKTMRQMPALTFTKVKTQSTVKGCSHLMPAILWVFKDIRTPHRTYSTHKSPDPVLEDQCNAVNFRV